MSGILGSAHQSAQQPKSEEEELAEVTDLEMYHRVIAAMSKLDATAGGGAVQTARPSA